MTEPNPQPKIVSYLLEFEQHPELAGAVIKEVQPDIFDGLDFLDDYNQRHEFYNLEHQSLISETPNTQACVNRLSEAFGYYISPKNRKKAFGSCPIKRDKALEQLDKIGVYFRLGSYYGGLAYRLQNFQTDIPIAESMVDLPKVVADEITGQQTQMTYETYAEFFKLVESYDEQLTWNLSWAVHNLPIHYTLPLGGCEKGLSMGAITTYHLHHLAAWHKTGLEYAIAQPVNQALSEQAKDCEAATQSDQAVMD